jgi:hypothetical protein
MFEILNHATYTQGYTSHIEGILSSFYLTTVGDPDLAKMIPETMPRDLHNSSLKLGKAITPVGKIGNYLKGYIVAILFSFYEFSLIIIYTEDIKKEKTMTKDYTTPTSIQLLTGGHNNNVRMLNLDFNTVVLEKNLFHQTEVNLSDMSRC